MRFVALLFCLLGACARAPLKNPAEAMRLSQHLPSWTDDLGYSSLIPALEADLNQLRTLSTDLNFGPRRVRAETYARALEFLVVRAKEDPSGQQFLAALRANFEAYEVYGQEDWGQVFITSYFAPVIEGAPKKTERFSQALYGLPKDLVTIDLSSFPSREGILRGRWVRPVGKEDIPKVIAYPDRANMEAEGQGPPAEILAWVDPVDAFFLEIQGSGSVKFKDGKELRLGYAAQNGWPYVPIGKFLADEAIPKDKITLRTIEDHLRKVEPAEARRIMNLNPSYVFFRKLDSAGKTFFGAEVVAGRTIATDQNLFPKGALAYLEFEKPAFDSKIAAEPARFDKAARFVLDQDTGGAIRGPHRVDLFWGKGDQAKQSAGVMKGKGKLVYLVPSLKFVATLEGGDARRP